jgi:hypothetical protein
MVHINYSRVLLVCVCASYHINRQLSSQSHKIGLVIIVQHHSVKYKNEGYQINCRKSITNCFLKFLSLEEFADQSFKIMYVTPKIFNPDNIILLY